MEGCSRRPQRQTFCFWNAFKILMVEFAEERVGDGLARRVEPQIPCSGSERRKT
jgi:hypothetical protein